MSETAVLGGGCFWCTESVFVRLRGVTEVTPGYAGGHVENPGYEHVCSGSTGHIEVVRVVFDPNVIDFATLLRVFFGTHDPTTPDRQGGDVGTQYASAIFCQDDAQKETAQAVIAEVQAEIGQPVVTHVFGPAKFWPAETYHHNYYERNPWQGYCQAVISPKVAKLRQKYADLLSA